MTFINGGHGAVRDICEVILRRMGKYEEFLGTLCLYSKAFTQKHKFSLTFIEKASRLNSVKRNILVSYNQAK